MDQKLKIFVPVFILSVLALSLPVFAQDDVDVTLSPSHVIVNTSETATVEITVQNNKEVDDTFSLTVWPSIKWSGITPNLEKYLVKVSAMSSFTSDLYLTADSGAEETVSNFLVTAKSLTNSSIIDSESVKVEVKRKTAVYISDIKLDKYTADPSDPIAITITITNSGDGSSLPLKVQTNVKSDMEILERFDDDIGQLSGKTIKSLSHTYEVGDYLSPGTYSVEVVLRDSLNKLIGSRSVTFKVSEVRNLVQESSVSYSLFSQIKVITVRNEGNSLEQGFYVTESVPSYVKNFFLPEDEPDKVEEKDNRIVYSWYVESLTPGSETSIKYEVRFFSIWIIGLTIIAAVVLAFKYVYSPKIIKKHKIEGKIKRGKEIIVSLEVRNPTLHEIKDVVVSDLITPIAVVIDKFDTMRPKIKKTEHGTELTWKIKSLKPMEERVLTYTIKPVVEIIGTLRLPKATIRYTDRRKKKKAIASKVMIIKGG
jgi:hypothetical protein